MKMVEDVGGLERERERWVREMDEGGGVRVFLGVLGFWGSGDQEERERED